jgi:hypothetical protein
MLTFGYKENIAIINQSQWLKKAVKLASAYLAVGKSEGNSTKS